MTVRQEGGNDIQLKEKLCLKFCPYYKPSKKEELACQGFLVIERLLREGKYVAFDIEAHRCNVSTEALVKGRLCQACSFYENDCDFILKEGGASPCGGFILIVRLLQGGIISVDDIGVME